MPLKNPRFGEYLHFIYPNEVEAKNSINADLTLKSTTEED
jgi:hypothetical protein